MFKFNETPEQVENTKATNQTTGYGPAPELTPFSMVSDGDIEVITTAELKDNKDNERYSKTTGRLKNISLQTINVAEKFPWTHSPSKSREDVPTLILREEYIKYNPLFNQLAYNLFNSTDMLSQTTLDSIAEAIPGISGKVGTVATLGMSKTATEVMTDFGESVKQIVKDLKDDPLAEKHQDFHELKDFRKHLEPYQRLYSTWPTGFKYKLPYFNDDYKSVSPNFSSGPQGTGIPFEKQLSSAITGIGSLANILNATSPGVYVEAPKYPGFPADTRSYTVTFPLFNTESYEKTRDNWQFVFLLLYQNSPNRVNRSIILPPRIYEARIPGVWYSRYAYLSNISVTMQGKRRQFPLTLPGSGFDGEVNTVIPDAFQVDITVSELIPESQNYLFESIRRSDLVQVDVRDSNAGAAEDVGVVLEKAKDVLGS